MVTGGEENMFGRTTTSTRVATRRVRTRAKTTSTYAKLTRKIN